MRTRLLTYTLLAASAGLLLSTNVKARPFFFSTGNTDLRIGTLSRPDLGGSSEFESADDFPAVQELRIDSATFTGLIAPTAGATPTIGSVVVEIYRIFPKDSDTTRTPFPDPPFTPGQNLTRTNSPSDIAIDSRSSGAGLTFTITQISPSAMADNSVTGINTAPVKSPAVVPATGEEVQFNVTFTTPFDLPGPDHYFFVPQVQVTGGQFLWLSAPRPIVAPPGTAFVGFPDLQSWIRDAAIDPDWVRIGTDIVGGTTFNGTFSLTGVIPEPASVLLVTAGLIGLGAARRKRR